MKGVLRKIRRGIKNCRWERLLALVVVLLILSSILSFYTTLGWTFYSFTQPDNPEGKNVQLEGDEHITTDKKNYSVGEPVYFKLMWENCPDFDATSLETYLTISNKETGEVVFEKRPPIRPAIRVDRVKVEQTFKWDQYTEVEEHSRKKMNRLVPPGTYKASFLGEYNTTFEIHKNGYIPGTTQGGSWLITFGIGVCSIALVYRFHRYRKINES